MLHVLTLLVTRLFTLSDDKLRKIIYAKQTNTKTLQKHSITQGLRTNLGRSFEATTVIQPVWLI